jgi:stage V sporulation protein G
VLSDRDLDAPAGIIHHIFPRTGVRWFDISGFPDSAGAAHHFLRLLGWVTRVRSIAPDSVSPRGPGAIHVMQLTDVRVHLCDSTGRLKAFCCLTFDDSFVVRDVKLIEGDEGLFLAMPARKLCDHCPRCHEKNHLRARYCNHCGLRIDENRHAGARQRIKLHADVAHPINPDLRRQLEGHVIDAFYRELERSKLPGYVPTRLDDEAMMRSMT